MDLGAIRKSSNAVPIVAALVALVAAAGVAAFVLVGRTKTPAPASVLPVSTGASALTPVTHAGAGPGLLLRLHASAEPPRTRAAKTPTTRFVMTTPPTSTNSS